MGVTATGLRARLDSMVSRRQIHESNWQTILDYCMPHRGRIIQPGTRGYKPPIDLYDNTAVESNELLAAALHGIVTNPFSMWFGFRVPYLDLRDDEEVKDWIDVTERITYEIISDSNFDPQVHEGYLDLDTIGHFAMYAGEGDTDPLYFDTLPAGEVYFDENFEGKVDTAFRVFPLTARQAKQMFRPYQRRLSEGIHKAAKRPDGGGDEEFKFLHAVFPRTDRDPLKSDAMNKPWVSVYVELDARGSHNGDSIIYESGFDEFPYVVPRSTVASGEIYARSAGLRTLPLIRMINAMARTVLRGGQKAVEPGLQVPDDGFLQPVANNIPNGINPYRAGTNDRIEAMPSGDPQFGVDLLKYYEERIKDGFYLNQLQLIAQSYMTAEEVMQRTAERDRVLGPLLGRLRHEFLKPLMQRVFGVLYRGGYYPDPPASLAGRPITVEYVSPLARAQRLHEAQGIARTHEIMTPIWQANPESMDIFDMDMVSRVLAEVNSYPRDAIRKKADVAKIREDRAERMQQQQQVEQLQALAAAAKDGAQAGATAGQMGEGA